ncbi:MAG TPA: radical SAM protein [Pirellulales bacterium]|jgi:radical SAM superfamily enzyme YgiQ (UPF0313 family)|nr:radical SAM protein [Pirellulales bacterium]
MAEIVLINPRFEVSYWGLEHALPFLGKRANLPVACLPLLAALVGREHRITLVDENVEAIDYGRLARADIVGLTGMSVQRFRMREILTELKARGVFTVVGGPWVTVQEDYFGDLADVIFVGEAEETWPQFLRGWRMGNFQHRYEQSERSDMSHVPLPRYDLLKNQHYLFGSVQFSRGCPFQCEFCDIIVTFGRRPRLKTTQQIVAELEAQRAQNVEVIFIVDDNLIGNKRAIKPVLREIAAWQRSHGYPLTFFTEASLDLAEDEELIELMVEANFTSVFIGIESPNEESLRETKKYQNVRAGATIVERVKAIQRAGIDVWCGMIVGFDHDDPAIFDAQREFLEQSRILHAMVGMLHAIPKTPLHQRLAEAGRLDWADENPFGTNVIPLGMTREQLRDGYLRVMRELYEPAAYFERLESLYLDERFVFGQSRIDYWRKHPWTRLKAQSKNLARSIYIAWQLFANLPDRKLRREYRRRIARFLKVRRDPAVLFVYLIKCAMHYHHYTMARQMAEADAPVVNSF